MTFDISKPYRMRDGRAARAVEGPDGLYGWAETPSNQVSPMHAFWRKDGRVHEYGESSSDLVNTPEKRTVKVWINCHDDIPQPCLIPWRTREDADRRRYDIANPRIACIEREISFVVGEGLDSEQKT